MCSWMGSHFNHWINYNAQLRKVQCGSPGQADFLAGQVTFKAYLPNGQGLRQDILLQVID